MPTGVEVDLHSRRIFVDFPRWGEDVQYTVGEIVDDKVVPYPDAPGFGASVPGGAKLIAINLKTTCVTRTSVLPPDVALPPTYLNDGRIDFRAGKEDSRTSPIPSINGPRGIVGVDLDSGATWRRLSGRQPVQPDPSFVPVVEGERAMIRAPGKPPARFRVAADILALSAVGSTLYRYTAPTVLLRDRGGAEDKLARLSSISATSVRPRVLRLMIVVASTSPTMSAT